MLFFGIGMKIDLFQFCGHCWVSQICQYMEGGTLTASCFSILNSLTGIPLPPIPLLVVMLSHLTSYFRMSGCRCVTTSPWLPGSLRPFIYSSVHSCYFFLISITSVKSLPFLSYIVPILAWNVVLISPVFLKRSLVFPFLLFSSISLHCSLTKAFLFLFAIL